MADYALVAYPLSSQFRARFEEAAGVSPTYLRLSDLRRLGPWGALKTLALLRIRRLLLPLEDESSQSILPILQALSLATAARSVEVFRHDLQEKNPLTLVQR